MRKVLVALLALAPSLSWATWGIDKWGTMTWGQVSGVSIPAVGGWSLGILALSLACIGYATRKFGARRVAPFLLVLFVPFIAISAPPLITFNNGEVATQVNGNFQSLAAEIDAVRAVAVPDNLGSHMATQTLNLGGFSLIGANAINAQTATLASTLSVNGPLTAATSLSVTGPVNLALNGSSTTVNGSASVAGMMTVFGSASMRSSASVLGPASLQSTLTVTGATVLQNTLGVTGQSTFASNVAVNGAVSAASFNVTSDERAKKDIEDLSERDMREMLDRLTQVRLVRFRFRDETGEHDAGHPGQHRRLPHVGVTAQSMPDEVVEDGELLRVNISDTIGYLIASIRALRVESREQAERQSVRIRELEDQVAALERRLQAKQD